MLLFNPCARSLLNGNAAADFVDPPAGNNNHLVDLADLTFTSPSLGLAKPAVGLYNSQPIRSWGNRTAEWLCPLSCDVLKVGHPAVLAPFGPGAVLDLND